jgi:hypothetical protein
VYIARMERVGYTPIMIAEARQGDWDAHDWLWQTAILLTARAVPLPPLLQEYLVVDAPTFKGRRGRPRGSGDGSKRIGIAIVVEILTRSGLQRSRHPRTRSDSPTACSIVVEALRELGITKTEGAVKKIFEQHRSTAERAAAASVQMYENK